MRRTTQAGFTARITAPSEAARSRKRPSFTAQPAASANVGAVSCLRAMDVALRCRARVLRFLCQDIGELRRGDHNAKWLRLDLERFAEANKEEQLRAFALALDETKRWPEVQQAFQAAFALYRKHKSAQSPAKSN